MTDALHEAILSCDSEGVTFLISAGVSVNKLFQDGVTPLNSAIGNGNDVIARMLMEAGAYVNQSDSFRVDCSSRKPIHYAAACNNLQLLKDLLDMGVKVDEGDYGDATPLHHAAACGNTEIVKYLLDLNCDVNHKSNSGRTPLWKAAQNGHREAVQLLFAAGANLNTRNQVGATVLFDVITQENLIEIACELIHLGIDVNIRDIDGNTALHGAASLGKVKAVQTLLNAGIDLGVQNEYGNSALLYAVIYNQVGCSICLLNHGAQYTMNNWSRQSPLYCAMLHQCVETTTLLHNVGARLTAKEAKTFSTYEATRNERKEVFFMWTQSFFRIPKSLTATCRAVIRDNLTGRPVDSAKLLPLPDTVVEYLLLKDLQDVSEEQSELCDRLPQEHSPA